VAGLTRSRYLKVSHVYEVSLQYTKKAERDINVGKPHLIHSSRVPYRFTNESNRSSTMVVIGLKCLVFLTLPPLAKLNLVAAAAVLPQPRAAGAADVLPQSLAAAAAAVAEAAAAALAAATAAQPAASEDASPTQNAEVQLGVGSTQSISSAAYAAQPLNPDTLSSCWSSASSSDSRSCC